MLNSRVGRKNGQEMLYLFIQKLEMLGGGLKKVNTNYTNTHMRTHTHTHAYFYTHTCRHIVATER